MTRFIHRGWSRRSLTALEGVAAPLVSVATIALVTADHDFVVLEGLRSEERQKKLVEQGKSWTLNSRHLDGRAIDIGVLQDGEISWESHLYEEVAQAFDAAGKMLNVPLVWGGSWTQFDGGHYEIPRSFDWREH